MKRAVPAVFVLLCAAWYVRETIAEVVPSLDRPSDFSMYYQAAGNVATGHSPFVTEGYIYPPLLAEALTPLAAVSYRTARRIWFVISQACLLLAAWLLWRALGRDWISASVIAFVWALGGAATESLALGQPGPLLTLLLALALTELGWSQKGALSLGLAIKLIPGAAAAVFVLRRQWRAAAIVTIVSVLLLAIPWLYVVCCLDGPKAPAGTDTWTGTPAVLSWSLPSVVLRALDPPLQPGGPIPPAWETGNDLPHLHLPPERRWVSIGVALVVLLTGLAILARANLAAEGASQLAMAAMISLALAASPVCWTHYQVMQYPGLAVLLYGAILHQRWRTVAAAVVLGALLYPLPVTVLANYFMRYGSWSASPATFYFWDSIAPFASLGLFGLLIGEIAVL